VGLLKGLVLLPLAPVRGVAWLAERLADQAEREFFDEDTIRQRLDELQVARDVGEISDAEYDAAEGELLERLFAARGMGDAGRPGW
jgi:hypothetical protein